MKKKVNLNKLVFDKKIYKKNINTSFSQLGSPSIQEQLDDQPSIEEFFNMYTDLFYQINEVGPNKSHEFLIKSSGEYIKFDEQDELIEALQQEIVNIKKELLKSEEINQTLFPEEVTPAQENLPNEDEVDIPPYTSPLLNIVNTPVPPPPLAPPSAAPLPPANPDDQEMFDNGYTYQVITYETLVQNIGIAVDLNEKIIAEKTEAVSALSGGGLVVLKNNAQAVAQLKGISYEQALALVLEPFKYRSQRNFNLKNWDSGRRNDMLKDIRQAKENGNTKVGDEGTYNEWREAIKAKSSGKKKENLYTILGLTVDKLRQTFRETNKFGSGKFNLQDLGDLNDGTTSQSGYSSFN